MRAVLFSDTRVLYVGKNEFLGYKKGWLYYRKNNEKDKKCWIGSIQNRFLLAERLLRAEPRCAAKIDADHFIVSFNGTVLNYCCSNNTTKIEHYFDNNMHNPLEFLTVYNETTLENDVYYGEYIWNENKGPVAIYKRSSGVWNKVYSFPENTILHIHNIIHDPYRKGFLILTGDDDTESGIWFADYAFEEVVPMLIGKQQYRACIAFPFKDYILYATDTPLENNYIYRVSFIDNELRPEKEYDLPGPCIYGTRINNELLFATSVEPDSTLPPWRYRLSYRLGNGVKDRFGYIVKRNENGEYSTILKEKKDNLPMWLFQFGNIIFPKNDTDMIIGVFQSMKKGHGRTFKIL